MRSDALPPSLKAIADERPRPEPVIHPDTEAFWAGLSDGKLLVQRCRQCGTYRFPFAPICHRCRSFDLTWEPIAPEGLVATAVVVHRATGDPRWAAHVPFISGTVDMEHDIRLPGRILCSCGTGNWRGETVRVVLLMASGGVAIYAFAHGCVEADA